MCLLLGAGSFGLAQEHSVGQFQANLNGYNEVPSIITTASGQVTVAVASNQDSLTVTLNFTKLPNTDTAQSAALYLGLPGTTGGVVAWICGGGSKPSCPTTATGSVTATIATTDVLAVTSQGLTAGDLASVIQGMGSGAVYVNVIASNFKNGEIRGQLAPGFSFGNVLSGGGLR